MILPTFTLLFINGEWSAVSYPEKPEFPVHTGDAVINVHLPHLPGIEMADQDLERLKR